MNIFKSFYIDLTVWDMLRSSVLFLILNLVTIGLYWIIWPYVFIRHILENTYITSGEESADVTRRIVVTATPWDYVKHCILYNLLTIATLGIALPLYVYSFYVFFSEHCTTETVGIGFER